MDLINCSKGQRLELAVEAGDRCLHGGCGTGCRRQAWRALGRGDAASARGLERQGKDDARD
jgi:hypothetical protein